MNEDKLEEQDSLNLDEDTEPLDSEGDESPEVLKEKLLKAEETAKNQKIRAEKAEKLAKQLKDKPVEKETSTNSDFSLSDIRALGDVHDEDVDEVVDYAKFKGVSVAEAKKTSTIQNLLKGKEEERKTAQATNTGGSKKGSLAVTGEALLVKAEGGEYSDKEEDIKKIAEARFQRKVDNIKQ